MRLSRIKLCNVRVRNRRQCYARAGGPEPLSFLDIVAVYERVLVTKITVHYVAPGEPVPGFAEEMLGLLISFDMFDSPMDMTQIASSFNIKLTSIEEFAKHGAGS